MEPKHRLTSTNDPQHWRDRAEEARACAESISIAGGREVMLRCADDYELLAKRAAERLHWEKRRHVCVTTEQNANVDESGRKGMGFVSDERL